MGEMSGKMRLFSPGPDFEHNAFLGFTNDQWGHYVSGYARAAEILSSHAQANRGDLDILVFPIVFLSRHYLELLLKRTLLDAQALIGEPSQLAHHHDVAELWRLLRPMVLRIYSKDDPGQLADLDSVVAQIGELDTGSFRFRYPVDKSGRGSLPTEMTLINIRKFSELFARGARVLDGIQAGIATYLDSEAD